MIPKRRNRRRLGIILGFAAGLFSLFFEYGYDYLTNENRPPRSPYNIPYGRSLSDCELLSTEVSGRITNTAGEPLPDAKIYVNFSQGPILSTTPDFEGYFFLDDLELYDCTQFSITATSGGYAPHTIAYGSTVSNLIRIPNPDSPGSSLAQIPAPDELDIVLRHYGE